MKEELDNICEECKKEDESVSQNLIMHGYKICDSVLVIQLNSLQNNDYPYRDAGIEQTWEFAHPNNKIMTAL